MSRALRLTWQGIYRPSSGRQPTSVAKHRTKAVCCSAKTRERCQRESWLSSVRSLRRHALPEAVKSAAGTGSTQVSWPVLSPACRWRYSGCLSESAESSFTNPDSLPHNPTSLIRAARRCCAGGPSRPQWRLGPRKRGVHSQGRNVLQDARNSPRDSPGAGRRRAPSIHAAASRRC